MLDHLTTMTPDPSRSARTIARCHARLAAERRRVEARNRPRAPKPAAIERYAVFALCAGYLIAMANELMAAIR